MPAGIGAGWPDHACLCIPVIKPVVQQLGHIMKGLLVIIDQEAFHAFDQSILTEEVGTQHLRI